MLEGEGNFLSFYVLPFYLRYFMYTVLFIIKHLCHFFYIYPYGCLLRSSHPEIQQSDTIISSVCRAGGLVSLSFDDDVLICARYAELKSLLRRCDKLLTLFFLKMNIYSCLVRQACIKQKIHKNTKQWKAISGDTGILFLHQDGEEHEWDPRHEEASVKIVVNVFTLVP